eukprot:TRINITY_DN1395_c0_g1_i7.p5 TRINITY_DN1395_c0_g1~~TRINITY_DN1395_c0_g1_i7.p5  ORF type:complete len:128 (+),score=14.65 TRINITY_DN1395_c0_g1_i7:1380-1763(+)
MKWTVCQNKQEEEKKSKESTSYKEEMKKLFKNRMLLHLFLNYHHENQEAIRTGLEVTKEVLEEHFKGQKVSEDTKQKIIGKILTEAMCVNEGDKNTMLILPGDISEVLYALVTRNAQSVAGNQLSCH